MTNHSYGFFREFLDDLDKQDFQKIQRDITNAAQKDSHANKPRAEPKTTKELVNSLKR